MRNFFLAILFVSTVGSAQTTSDTPSTSQHRKEFISATMDAYSIYLNYAVKQLPQKTLNSAAREGWTYQSSGQNAVGFPYGTKYPIENADMRCVADVCYPSVKENKDCPDIDFRPQLPPVRDQDSLGWCYAMGAADLISFKMGKAISAIDVAISTEKNKQSFLDSILNRNTHRGTENGASLREVLDSASKKGFCPESDMPLIGGSASDVQSALKKYLDSVEALDRTSRNSSKSALNRICPEAFKSIHNFLPNLSYNDLRVVLEKGESGPLLDRLDNKLCHRIYSKDAIKFQAYSTYDLDHLLGNDQSKKAAIEKLIRAGYPVGIGYDAGILKPRSGVSGGHVSSVVGQRWNRNSNRCEFIVRNSWGKSCANYIDASSCDGGNLFIPQDDLVKSIQEIAYVE